MQSETWTTQQRASELLAGWTAARSRLPMDPTTSGAWQDGWRLWTDRGQYKAARLAVEAQARRVAKLNAVLREF